MGKSEILYCSVEWAYSPIGMNAFIPFILSFSSWTKAKSLPEMSKTNLCGEWVWLSIMSSYFVYKDVWPLSLNQMLCLLRFYEKMWPLQRKGCDYSIHTKRRDHWRTSHNSNDFSKSHWSQINWKHKTYNFIIGYYLKLSFNKLGKWTGYVSFDIETKDLKYIYFYNLERLVVIKQLTPLDIFK